MNRSRNELLSDIKRSDTQAGVSQRDEEQILRRRVSGYRGIDSLVSFKAGFVGEDARPAQFRDVNPDRRPWNRSSLSGRPVARKPGAGLHGAAMENRREAFCRLHRATGSDVLSSQTGSPAIFSSRRIPKSLSLECQRDGTSQSRKWRIGRGSIDVSASRREYSEVCRG